ncbi:MAG: hypothetical protein U0930_13370 [Pirellulales bacterium]
MTNFYGWKFLTSVDRAESIASVPWLPTTASNVSYACTYGWQYYEFDISEAGFRDWASSWKIEEIREPFYITTYRVLDARAASVYDGPRDFLIGELQDLPDELPSYTAVIKSGLYFYSYNSKNHGGLYIAFDRNKQRAYYHYHAR